MHVLRPPRLRLGRRAIAAMLGAATLAAIAPAAALATAAPAGAITSCDTWKSPGTNGLFDDASNWTNGVPTSGADACIPASAIPYNVVMTTSATVHGLSVGAGATLYIEGNTTAGSVMLMVANGNATNAGTIDIVSAGTSLPTNSLALSGTTLVNDGTIRVDPGQAQQLIAGSVHNTANGTIDVANDTEIFQLDNDGFVNVENGATFTVDAFANYVSNTHTLTRGQLDLAGVLALPNADVVALDSEVSLLGSGELFDSSAQAPGMRNLRSITANGGLYVGNSTTRSFGPLTNNGRVSIGAASALNVYGAYTQAGSNYTSLSQGAQLNAIGSTVTVVSGAIVGAGTISGNVVNTGGTLYPAQQLSVNGNYTQGAGGTIDTRVGGPAGAGTIDVTGTATLGGTLSVTLDSSAAPQPGLSWLLVTAGTRTGSFATIVSPGLRAPFQAQATTAPSALGVVIVANYNDNDLHVAYQGWQAQYSGVTPSSTIRYTCTGGDVATFAFSGISITWNAWHGPQMGNAQVLIDNANKGTFDLYSSTNATYAKSFTGLATGAHTITVRALGTKNASSQNPCVVVDGFKVGTTVTDDSAAAITWSGWTGVAGTNGYRAATAAGKFAQLSTNMTTGVEWITRTGPNQGKAQVFVDSVLVKTVNLYTPAVHTGVRVSIPAPSGGHKITISVLGTKDPASTGTTVAIDGFVVH